MTTPSPTKYEPNAADGIDYQGEMGIPRPEGQPALGIGEVDGPYHLALRHALAPFFSPGAVQKMQPFMEERAHWFLDQRIGDGRDGPGARLRKPAPGHPHHEVDGPALRQLAALRQPLPLGHGSPRDKYRYRADAIAEVPAMMQGVLEFAATRSVPRPATT